LSNAALIVNDANVGENLRFPIRAINPRGSPKYVFSPAIIVIIVILLVIVIIDPHLRPRALKSRHRT